MGFRTGSYATCFSIEPGKGNFTKVRLSISKKNKETGQYEQDFSGYCTFIGNAHALASRLKERDRIKLGDIDVSNTYDKEAKKEYVNYKVFSFDIVSSGTGGTAGGIDAAQQGDNAADGAGDPEKLPF
ncbi:MAG: hypothetical protein IKN04_14840 [Clostridia bacterium]|nr:hypothetical protein [Clostridia bacterium]